MCEEHLLLHLIEHRRGISAEVFDPLLLDAHMVAFITDLLCHKQPTFIIRRRSDTLRHGSHD